MKAAKIRSIEELKGYAFEKNLDCFIALNGGLRSSKGIYFTGKRFEILNEIDGTTQNLTEKELMDKDFTNIGQALLNGALYRYQY